MSTPKHIAASCLLAAMGCITAMGASAQEVELYDQAQFRGTRLKISADAPDVAAYGLGGRIGSVVVRSGQWEFCTAAQFGGACITVGPGRYGTLPPALAGNLMSARRADVAAASATGVAAGAVTASPADHRRWRGRGQEGAESVVLYDSPDGGGRALTVNGAMDSLEAQGFNDAAQSIWIRRGEWQLCEHNAYQGACLTLGPGRHNLNGNTGRRLSSIRPLQAGTTYAPVAGAAATAAAAAVATPAAGGIPYVRSVSTGVVDAVVLYEHANFQGRQLAVSGPLPNLGEQGFNDTVSSVVVQRGRWQLCEHNDFAGQCITLGQGRHALETTFNDKTSSIRPLYGTSDQPLSARGGIVLHDRADMGGRQAVVGDTITNLKTVGMNDATQAVEVLSGAWELCTDSNFRGQCVVLPPGRYQLDGPLRGSISSIRPRQ